MFAKETRKPLIFVSIAAAGAILCGAALGGAIAATTNLKNQENFSEFNPALPTRILDVHGELITEFASEEKRELITLDQLPTHVIQALIAREDRVFYEHGGFTVKSIMRAVFGKLTGQSLGGGSTITQQLAGTLYLDRSDISISRKLKELWWAFQLERRYSKDEILEMYLNKVYLGSGTFGINAASKFYFGHSASELTPAEAAILMIQLSNPALYNPFEHPNRAQERQRQVLDQMVELGYLTKAAADNSFEDYWGTFDYSRTSSSAYFSRVDKARWFSEHVRQELESMLYGTMNLYTDGYVVHTSLDLEQQAEADKVFQNWLAEANKRFKNSSTTRFDKADQYADITAMLALAFDLPQLAVSNERTQIKSVGYYRDNLNPLIDILSLTFGIDGLKTSTNKANAAIQEANAETTVEGALLTLDNDTGYITAMIGGSKFEQSNQYNRAMKGEIQPGSTFKPLYYSAAIDSRKFTEASMISDTPVVFYNESGVPYTPLNFKGEWKGTVLLYEALAHSMNVPSIRILDGIGFDAAINRAALLLGYNDRADIESRFPRVYPLGLGVISVAPWRMAKAFATFASGGKELTPIAIRSVEDRNGRVIIDREKEVRLEQKRKGNAIQIISPQNAYIMTDMLQNTVKSGTLAWASGYGSKFAYKDENGKTYYMPVAGKTGTTQNWSDAWTVGFTPYYTTAIWFGFDKGGMTLGLDNTGATLAGIAWSDYMGAINAGLPYRDFTRPQNGIVTATVCKKSGELPTDACTDGSITLQFLEGTEPKTYCTYHENGENLKRTSVERLQSEGFAAGQRPINVDTSALTLDPAIFEDPAPRVKPRNEPILNGETDTNVNTGETGSTQENAGSPNGGGDTGVSESTGEGTGDSGNTSDFNPLLE